MNRYGVRKGRGSRAGRQEAAFEIVRLPASGKPEDAKAGDVVATLWYNEDGWTKNSDYDGRPHKVQAEAVCLALENVYEQRGKA